MRFRSTGNSISVGIAVLAFVAAGALPALAEDPTADPTSGDPTADPVTISMSASGGSAVEGGTVTVSATVTAAGGTATGVNVSVSASGGTLGGECSGGCNLGEVAASKSTSVTVTSGSPGTVTVSFSATSDNAGGASAPASAEFTAKPTETPTTPPPTTSNPSPSRPPNRDPIRLPGGGTSSGGLNRVAAPTLSNQGGPRTMPDAAAPPQVNSGFRPFNPAIDLRAPQVALPPVAPPTVAPPSPISGASARLMSNTDPLAQEPGFERLAALQAGWLSALVVAFTLLLIHVRLGRQRFATILATAMRPRRKPAGGRRG